MSLSLSTCWNSKRHTCGRVMIDEILSLGFRSIELSHGIHSPMLKGILAAKERHRFAVSSVHNFLPMPIEVIADAPDCYEFSSHRAADRTRAMRLSKQTIDWAERLQAPFVVVHCGRVPLQLTASLRKIVEEGGLFSREYAQAKLDAVRRREENAETFIQRVLDCLVEIADYAGSKGVKLGVENREYFEAVPSEREFISFLRRLDSAHVGYWHDFGHAQIKHNLGLLNHAQWLARAGPLALGCHVHDVRWPFRDHSPPFSGEIEYKKLRPLLPEKCQMVIELSPRAKREEVEAARDRWLAEFPGDGFP